MLSRRYNVAICIILFSIVNPSAAYKDEVHYTDPPAYLRPNKHGRMLVLQSSVLFSTLEVDVTVAPPSLAPCFDVLLVPPAIYTPLVHVRRAQLTAHPLVAHGEGVVHLDFSLPTWLLPRMADWLRALNATCAPFATHPGKATLELAAAYSEGRVPPVASLPPQMLRVNATFQALVDAFDTHGLFTPQHVM